MLQADEQQAPRKTFRRGRRYYETAPYSVGKVARYYLAACNAPDSVRLSENPQLGRAEHHEYRWLTGAQARELLTDRVRAVLDWAASVLHRSGC